MRCSHRIWCQVSPTNLNPAKSGRVLSTRSVERVCNDALTSGTRCSQHFIYSVNACAYYAYSFHMQSLPAIDHVSEPDFLPSRSGFLGELCRIYVAFCNIFANVFDLQAGLTSSMSTLFALQLYQKSPCNSFSFLKCRFIKRAAEFVCASAS